MLHYITLEHEHKQAALTLVDRDLCVQLNRERRVVFSLPAAPVETGHFAAFSPLTQWPQYCLFTS